MRPLVVIPYIYTQAQLERRKHLLRYLAIVFAVLLTLSLLIVHLLVMPIDLLLVKLMAKFG
jgi:polysaccharide biosynthesis transport protein